LPAIKHDFPLWAAAFSPDGQTFLTGSGDNQPAAGASRRIHGKAALWDTATGQQLLPEWPHPSRVFQVAFSPDGRTVLTVCAEEARLWRTADGTPIGQPLRHPSVKLDRPAVPPLTAVFSPDGKLVATGGADGTARLWDVGTATAHGEPLEATGPVLALAFSPDSKLLVTGSLDSSAQMWEVAGGGRHGPVLKHRGRVKTVAFSPDGSTLATGGAIEGVNADTGGHAITGGEVRLWRSATGRDLGTPLVHPAVVWAVAFSPGGRLLLTGCEDANARFFLVATGAPLGKPLGHGGTVGSVAFSRDGTLALTSSAGGDAEQHARLWQLPAEKNLPQPLMQRGQITAMSFSPDGRTLLTGADDPAVRLWDVQAGTVTTLPAPGTKVVVVAVFAPDGRSFLTGHVQPDGQSVLRLWDRATDNVRHEGTAPGRLTSGTISPSGQAALMGFLDGEYRVWDLTTGKWLTKFSTGFAPVRSIACSPDGRQILMAGNYLVRLWPSDGDRPLREWKIPTTNLQGGFFPDGKRVLLLNNGFAQVWDLAGERMLGAPLFHPGGGIRHAVFAPDGGSVVTVDVDKVARLWDVATGKTLGPPLGYHLAGPVAFAANGKRLACGGLDGRIALWDTPAPVEGSVQRVRLWVEVLTGMELDSGETIRELSPEAIQQRRQQLHKLGGAPTGPT
jgi:WD40 repeat protein